MPRSSEQAAATSGLALHDAFGHQCGNHIEGPAIQRHCEADSRLSRYPHIAPYGKCQAGGDCMAFHRADDRFGQALVSLACYLFDPPLGG